MFDHVRRQTAPKTQDPAVQKLVDAMESVGKSWTELGEALGYTGTGAYQGPKAIRDGRRKFDEGLRARAARFLGYPEDYFEIVPADVAREREIARVFAEFLSTPTGQQMKRDHPSVVASLRRMPLVGELRPSVTLYQTLALTWSAQTQIPSGDRAEVLRENEAREAAAKLARADVEAAGAEVRSELEAKQQNSVKKRSN